MEPDHLAHCRRACRPSVVWLELCLIGRLYDLGDDVLKILHEFISKSIPAEKAGIIAYMDMQERKALARLSRGAERVIPFYQIVGFRTLNGYHAHLAMEKKAELDRELANIPEWLKFGYPDEDSFTRAQRVALRKSNHRRQSQMVPVFSH